MPASPGNKPNVILILGDDWGWPYYGFMGHPIVKTPNLDKLAAEGITFVNGTSAAAHCRPSLQSLMTGLNQRDIPRLGGEVLPVQAIHATLDGGRLCYSAYG